MLNQNEPQDSEKEVIIETSNDITKDKEGGISFTDTLKASFIDTIVVGALSAVMYLVVQLIFAALGYYIIEKAGIFAITFVVVSFLYYAIIQGCKYGNTIGNKLSGIKITK